MPGPRNARTWAAAVLAAVAAGAAGCVHTHPGLGSQAPASGIAVPPPGTVPTELSKVTLPPYVIEAPDVLSIDVVTLGEYPELDANQNPVKVNGKDVLKPGYRGLEVQPISGQFLVRADGKVDLGFWGTAMVAGMTVEQASLAVRQQVVDSPALKNLGVAADKVFVILDVAAYNSKWYYVFLDGGGNGEQVIRLPFYGSESVLDAIANVGGIHQIGSKRNVWVARRCPVPGRTDQILPVDWVGLSQHGVTETNYQLMPGDRVYVAAQRLVVFDTALSRVIAPVERLFGITLLGSSTVNQISGRGFGFNN